MSKRRGVLLNLTLLVASTIFCLVVVEAALRFFPVTSACTLSRFQKIAA
jgi:hypothetical protein